MHKHLATSIGDRRASRALGEVILRTREGLPYPAPEVQLLFEAKGITSRRPLFRKKSKNLFESSKILLDTWPTTLLQ
jgi:hypothetical protein